MKNAVITGLYLKHNETFGDIPEQESFGNNLQYPGKLAARLLKRLGFSCCSETEVPFAEADLLICVDLNPSLWQRVQQTPQKVKKILLAVESPIYAPLSHDGAQVLRNPIWDLVMTWNRSFFADYILHYDIPMAGQDVSTYVSAKPKNFLTQQQRGVVVASYKRDYRGFLYDRNRLYKYLAATGEVDLYGRRWGHNPSRHRMGLSSNKLLAISTYAYSLVVENTQVYGYVTEKIADSILAGAPVIYWGDWGTAERRFPGTFVPLHQVNQSGFAAARQQLFANYQEHLQSVEAARVMSKQWCDSYLTTLEKTVQSLFFA